MLSRWLLGLCLLACVAGATVRYDMSRDELLQELGKPTSILARGNREVLIYPNNVRIEIEGGKVVGIKGIDFAAAEAPPAAVAGEATPPPAPQEDAEPALTPEQQQAQDDAAAQAENASAEASAQARAEMEKAITDLENLGSQAEAMPGPSFSVTDFLVELIVKWLLTLAALKLTSKYWNADIEWSGLMIAAAADTGVRAVVLGIGEGLLGMFSVFYADEAAGALVLMSVLRKVSTNQSLQQAVTITMTSKVFSIVVGSFLSVVILRAVN